MTWNIHAAIGPDRRADLARIIALVQRHAPDIVALQEIEARHRDEPPFRLLREALGGHAVEAPTIVEASGQYGHMLISRWPIRKSALHDISVPGRERRAVIGATIAAPGGELRVFCTHFGLRPGERRLQAARLAALAAEPAPGVLVMGDFNEWTRPGPVHRGARRGAARAHPAAHLSRTPSDARARPHLFPSRQPAPAQLDRRGRAPCLGPSAGDRGDHRLNRIMPDASGGTAAPSSRSFSRVSEASNFWLMLSLRMTWDNRMGPGMPIGRNAPHQAEYRNLV